MSHLLSPKKQIKNAEEENCFVWRCVWHPNNNITESAIAEELYLLKHSDFSLFTHHLASRPVLTSIVMTAPQPAQQQLVP